jgi:hypothetical protein
MSIGGRANERRSADVDFLDEPLERQIRIRGGRCKGVQVDGDEVDESDPLPRERREIVGPVAPRQNAAMNGRMKRFDPAVHHLRHTRQRGDGRYLEPGLCQRARRAAGRNESEASLTEAACKVDDPGLVRDAQQGSSCVGHLEARGFVS